MLGAAAADTWVTEVICFLGWPVIVLLCKQIDKTKSTSGTGLVILDNNNLAISTQGKKKKNKGCA